MLGELYGANSREQSKNAEGGLTSSAVKGRFANPPYLLFLRTAAAARGAQTASAHPARNMEEAH